MGAARSPLLGPQITAGCIPIAACSDVPRPVCSTCKPPTSHPEIRSMQASLVQKPTAAFTARRASNRAPRAAVVCAAQQPGEPEWRVQRRSLAALLAAAPALLPAGRALALLPDDDDEELIERAKANRKARLASERATEQEFKRTGGYVSRTDEKDFIKVQKVVNSLAKSGSQLEAGDLSAAAATISGVASELRAASASLSNSDAAKGSADKLLASVSSLETAARAGSARDAKQGFVATVDALTTWVGSVGIAGQIKGL